MSTPNHTESSSQFGRPHEITLRAIVLGLLLSVIMGAANIYLGLKVGMTVSASIPAAVIAMGILRGFFRDGTILESNLVQTAASAGESLAAGIIFTMPALILAGIWQEFDFWTTTLIALSGGLFGVLLMIPMRRVFVVENTELKYPEGLACAEVLRVGSAQGQSTGVGYVIAGICVGAIFKLAISLLGILRGAVEGATLLGSRVFFFGGDTSPALLAVGFIVGLPIAVQIFAGGAIAWLVAIPLFGTTGVETESAVEAAKTIWSTEIRYMGVGAMLVGGIASLWKVRRGLLAAVNEMMTLVRGKSEDTRGLAETERNIGGSAILALGLLCVALIGGLYYVLLDYTTSLAVLITCIMVVMSFFFAAVASYIVGLVGNSNSPVSGMTITAVLGTGLLIMLFGFTGQAAMLATLGVAGVVCCVACTSGDVCNDLKTGHLVGASPRSQQIMQVVGVLVAAFVMAPVLTVLHEGSLNAGTGGIGGDDLSAPQASLFASLAQGFFGDESLPRDMVFWGVGIGIALLVLDQFLAKANSSFRLHVMPVAVGMYLPFALSTPILLGGLLSALVAWRADSQTADAAQKRGVLLTSGMIAGESLVGVLVGVIAYFKVQPLSLVANDGLANTLSVVSLLAVAAMIVVLSLKSR